MSEDIGQQASKQASKQAELNDRQKLFLYETVDRQSTIN